MGDFDFNFIHTIIYLIPLGILVWKMSGIAHQVKRNTQDLTVLDEKLNEHINLQRTKGNELAEKVNKISHDVTALLTSMDHLKADLEVLKKERLKGE